MKKLILSSECTKANKLCSCKGWQASADSIFSAQMLAANHGLKYEGYKFNFCPWCGKKLEY